MGDRRRAAKAAGHQDPTLEEYVDRQYAGPKAALRPIFDAVATAALGMGDDVSAEGRSTYIPFVRRRQFAAIAAATRTRWTSGLNRGRPDERTAGCRWCAGQSTHRIALTSPNDVDEDVVGMLHAAYEQNG